MSCKNIYHNDINKTIIDKSIIIIYHIIINADVYAIQCSTHLFYIIMN